MAFKSKDLSVLAYANGFTLWHYTTIDSVEVFEAEGYFNAGEDQLRVGDMIMSNYNTDEELSSCILEVTSNNGEFVKVSDLQQGVFSKQ